MPLPLDPQARKQLLLTRIALERAEWVRDVERLRHRLTVSELLGSVLNGTGRSGWASALFGGRTVEGAAPAGWAGRIVSIALMLRRHPLWWPLIAGVWPWWRGRGRAQARPRRSLVGRLLVVGLGAGAAAAAAWWMRARPGRRSDTGA